MGRGYCARIGGMVLAMLLVLSLTHSAVGDVFNEEHKSRVLEKVSALQVPFIENVGQVGDGRVKYYAKTFGGTAFVTEDGRIVYSLPEGDEGDGWVIEERFVGAAIADVKGEDEAVTRVSYFKGNDPEKWRSGVATYNLVSLGELYPGIELRLKAHGDNIEKLFRVKPGGEPDSIRVRLEGAERLSVNGEGELEVETTLGPIKFTKPVAYQEESGNKKYIDVAYAIDGDGYGFKVGEYERSKELVIDPLLSSTFIGGSSYDYGYSIALDGSGKVYVAGYTGSSDFPTTAGAYDTTNNGSYDVFVARLDGNLSSLLSSTFIGGSSGDESKSIALDTSGNVYVAGYTYSPDFPTTDGSYDTIYNGGGDVFVARLDGNLSSLLASTFLGGSSHDWANSIALDASGNVYVAGWTESSDFPTTAGAYDTTFNGGYYDVFVARLDDNLSSLLSSTFIGGGYDDWGYSIALDGSGNVYVAGWTNSPDFPTTAGAYDRTWAGGSGYNDVFVARLSADLKSLLASTFIGGGYDDWGYSIALDGSGNVYVAGRTSSPDFPTTAGAYDTTFNGGVDVFVARLSGDLKSLLASTFIGGMFFDYAGSIALDRVGNVYVAGYAESSDFPTTAGAYDTTFNGGSEGFVARLSADLKSLIASTFIGGMSEDRGYSIALEASGNIYVAGFTSSPDFPTTAGAYDTTFNGGVYDAFVAKLEAALFNIPPTAEAGGPYTCHVGGTLALDGWASADSDGTIQSYAWDLNNDGQYDDATDATATYSCTTAGTQTVALQVTDNSGATATDTATINVNAPPVAEAGGPYSCYLGGTVTLDGSTSSDSDGTITDYEWDLDNDGLHNDAYGASVTYYCSARGTWTVGLRVTDDGGATATDTATVSVIASVSGAVTAEATGAPVAGVCIYAHVFETAQYVSYTCTDMSGSYAFGSLAAGRYRLRAYPSTASGLGIELYNDKQWYTADAVEVLENLETTGIDFSLKPGGSISGRVFSSLNGAPIAGVWVGAHQYETYDSVTSDDTDSNGYYRIDRLPAGSYRVNTGGPLTLAYVFERYDNVYDWKGASRVTVQGGIVTSGIDFSIAPNEGAISGTVFDSVSGNPVDGRWGPGNSLTVNAFDSRSGLEVSRAYPDQNGNYTIYVPYGEYKVRVYSRKHGGYSTDASGYAPQWHDGSVEGATDMGSAASIALQEGNSVVTGLNFRLSAGGIISGRITDSSDGSPVPGGSLSVWTFDAGSLVTATVAWMYDGTYKIDVPPGEYKVKVIFYDPAYADEYFCGEDGGGCDSEGAVRVTVETGQEVAGINFAADPAGSVSGQTTSQNDGSPVVGLLLEAYTHGTGGFRSWGYTDRSGNYKIANLPQGEYAVCARSDKALYTDRIGYTDLLPECYENAADKSSATTLPVSIGQDTPNINFALSACTPGDADGSGVVDILDVITALRVALGVEDAPLGLCAIDLDANGAIDVLDAIKIVRIAAGLE